MPSPVDFRPNGTGPSLFSVTDENISCQILSINRPPGGPLDERVVLAGAAWALANAVCNFTMMANDTCDIRLAGNINVGGHPGLYYRIKESNCSTVTPGLIQAVSTVDRIYVIHIHGADENDPRANRFLKSFALTK